jgi:hypothetical protein
MKYVEFLDKFKDIVLDESKQKTTRLRTTEDFCYYSEFMYESHRFVIVNVERVSIRKACDLYFRDEMFKTSDDMYEELKNIYKDKCNEDSDCFVISFNKIY